MVSDPNRHMDVTGDTSYGLDFAWSQPVKVLVKWCRGGKDDLGELTVRPTFTKTKTSLLL